MSREVVKLTRTEALEVMRAGAQAARDGEPSSACPFRVPGRDATERVKVTAWLRGYTSVAGSR